MNSKTKIIATLGPASADTRTIGRLLRAGVSVFRINCSHARPPQQRKLVRTIRVAARSTGLDPAILFDLQGPRIRLGTLAAEKMVLIRGQNVILSHRIQQPGIIPVVYPRLAEELKTGHRILINDGRVELNVRAVRKQCLYCRVMRGGEISSRKGLNFPDSRLKIPVITAKDVQDIKSGVGLGIDYFALSFVKNDRDIIRLRKLLRLAPGTARPHIIAKIERQDALDNIDGIIDAADGIMVARGDLGIELSLEKVPLIQKDLIHRCRQAGKPVITATQMLESMISSDMPTRAEVSDVHNAVEDGTDCVMLSGETAAGKFPVESVDWMRRALLSAESERAANFAFHGHTLQQAIAENARDIAEETGARYLVCFTLSGSTARVLAATHPWLPIVAMSPDRAVLRRLRLYHGVIGIRVPTINTIDRMIAVCKQALARHEKLRPGDRVVLVAGTPFHKPGTTNLIKIIEP